MAPHCSRYDVVILGGGLAGLSLARHLLLSTERRVLLLERRPQIPRRRQKVGESTVQVAGYYFSKVLDLEELLFDEHYMKYNLRFYFKTAGSRNDGLEHYSQLAYRSYSNVAGYQLDRNRFEAALLERNLGSPRFELATQVTRLAVDLRDGEAHRLRFDSSAGPRELDAEWVVDATGRNRVLARDLDLEQRNEVAHGASFLWVEGRVDIERLTGRSRREVRLDPQRETSGHLPHWLATCHFMGEGYWFWVIPLRGKTSLGLVFDRRRIDWRDVSTADKLMSWIVREFPLFARDLPQRRIVSSGSLPDFSHGCARTISPQRWALCGEAGRFSDPLYSPGSDLIATYNTLIVDAIESASSEELAAKCQRSEVLMRALYEAYLPSYATSYDAIGDFETMSLKYSWELSVYFAFYVFPFLNDLLVDRQFQIAYLNRFARLGKANGALQQMLSDFFQWKKVHPWPGERLCFDLFDVPTLRAAEKTFYRIGVDAREAREILDQQLDNLFELAQWIRTWIASQVLDDAELLRDRRFAVALEDAAEAAGAATAITLDVDLFCRARAKAREHEEVQDWTFEPGFFDLFRSTPLRDHQQ